MFKPLLDKDHFIYLLARAHFLFIFLELDTQTGKRQIDIRRKHVSGDTGPPSSPLS
jgi:hypothetical protein